MATIRKRGTKYQVMVRKKGHRPVSRSFTKHADAKRWAQETEVAMERRDWTDVSNIKDVTVGVLIERYLEEIGELKTISDSKKGNLHRLIEGLGHIPILDLKAADVVAHIKRRNLSPATAGMELGFLAEVLSVARAYWSLPLKADPVSDARRLLRDANIVGKGQERTRRPEADELKRLHAHWRANKRLKIPMVDLVEFAICSAMRQGEICELLWADLRTSRPTKPREKPNNLDDLLEALLPRRTILIRERKHPKQKRSEWVPLTPEALRIIKRQPRADARIFPYKPESVSSAFTRACQALGIEDLHYHDLRHEGVSRLFERGLQIHEVAMFSGHKDWAMLRRYTNLKPEDLSKKIGRRA
jgi:integrase